MKQIFTLAVLSLIALRVLRAEPAVADVLAKVSERYRNMKTFLIEADTRISFAQAGQMGVSENKTMLAVGTQGAFRLERNGNGMQQVARERRKDHLESPAQPEGLGQARSGAAGRFG